MWREFEFDVVVTVRKRLIVAGPLDRETARSVLHRAVVGGLGFGPFAKFGADGRPIETIVSNEFELVDPATGT